MGSPRPLPPLPPVCTPALLLPACAAVRGTAPGHGGQQPQQSSTTPHEQAPEEQQQQQQQVLGVSSSSSRAAAAAAAGFCPAALGGQQMLNPAARFLLRALNHVITLSPAWTLRAFKTLPAYTPQLTLHASAGPSSRPMLRLTSSSKGSWGMSSVPE